MNLLLQRKECTREWKVSTLYQDLFSRACNAKCIRISPLLRCSPANSRTLLDCRHLGLPFPHHRLHRRRWLIFFVMLLVIGFVLAIIAITIVEHHRHALHRLLHPNQSPRCHLLPQLNRMVDYQLSIPSHHLLSSRGMILSIAPGLKAFAVA